MSRVKHVMVDIETLSTKPNALVLAIGACEINFQLNDTGHKFYTSIDHNSYTGLDYHIDPDTVLWWMSQSEDARRAIYVDTGSRKPIHSVLEDLGSWMCDLMITGNGADELHVWGNGADFDNVVLTHFFKQCGVTQPWSFRGNRCFRTVKNLFPDTPDPADAVVKHLALQDAEWQANKLILINNRYNLGL